MRSFEGDGTGRIRKPLEPEAWKQLLEQVRQELSAQPGNPERRAPAIEEMARHLRRLVDSVWKREGGLEKDDRNELLSKILEELLCTYLPWKLANIENLEEYFRKSAKNRGIDLIRRRKRFVSLEVDLFAPKTDASASVEDADSQDYRRDLLTRVVARLSPDERKLYQLRFVQSKKNDELVLLLGCKTYGAAAQRVFRLLRRMRALVQVVARVP